MRFTWEFTFLNQMVHESNDSIHLVQDSGTLEVVQALGANPLYDPRFEHDACGLGLIARADGARSRELVERALAMLAAMEHRGARGADPDTGDGAGLMLQVPDRLLRRFCRAELELELPPPGRYAVAMCFLPTDPALRLRCEELCVRIAVEEGQQPLGWRDVPRDSSAIGRLARESEPVVRQLLVAQGPTGDERAFRRKLTVIRRRVELAAAARRVPEATFHIASFSSSTLTYKGLLTARQLPAYYADLREPEIETAMALVHSRFSTNTLGSWDLAHPFHYLAHNGEINTVRGNRQWMHAREPQLRSAQLGDDLPKLFPLIDERWSDSAALDAAFELLVLAGRAPAHALAMLIPAAWSQATPMADDVRAFYEFHAGMLEPWDGPAAVAFCDGRQAGATLDRNGLRPCRYQVTRDGLLVLASEAGVLELDPAEVVVNDRLRPGQMLIVDTDAGRIRGDDEIKSALARRRPYRALLDEQKIYLEDIPSPPVEPPARDALERDLRLFGYTDEELRDIIAPMARDGQEPIASMGVDTPLAALSRRPRLLRGFFKQLFAQVTNPAIDPQRETLVMSLRTAVGAQGNLLDESPDHARRLAMAQPVLTSGDLAKLRALPRDRFRTITLDVHVRRARRRAGARACARRALPPRLARDRAGRGDPRALRSLERRARGRADPRSARDRGRPQSPRARGLAHEMRPDRRVGRAARGDGLRAACRLRCGGRQSVRRARPRGSAVVERRRARRERRGAPRRATCRPSARACSRCSRRWASRP